MDDDLKQTAPPTPGTGAPRPARPGGDSPHPDPVPQSPVYLDHNATTPVDPRVREAMLPWLGERHGNPSSLHRFGQAAREAVEQARERVAALVGGRPREVVFTASGTEANNAVILGAGRRAGFRAGSRAGFRGRVLVSAFEHPSVRAATALLEEAGVEVVRVAPAADGVVRAEAFLAELTDDTLLACLMLANNEVGTLQPVAEVAAACRRAGVPVLCDAVQAVGKIPVDVEGLAVDYLTLGGHKFHGPPGVAALWVRDGRPLLPLLVGGSQEHRRRASTENVPGVVGLGEAARLAAAELADRGRHLAGLRDAFEAGVVAIPGARPHCTAVPRLPNTSHVAFSGLEAEPLLIRLDLAGFAVSTGSACASGAVEPSATLKAMGMETEEALASLRISFGITNRREEVDRFLAALGREVEELRRLLGSGKDPAREPAPAEPARA